MGECEHHKGCQSKVSRGEPGSRGVIVEFLREAVSEKYHRLRESSAGFSPSREGFMRHQRSYQEISVVLGVREPADRRDGEWPMVDQQTARREGKWVAKDTLNFFRADGIGSRSAKLPACSAVPHATSSTFFSNDSCSGNLVGYPFFACTFVSRYHCQVSSLYINTDYDHGRSIFNARIVALQMG